MGISRRALLPSSLLALPPLRASGHERPRRLRKQEDVSHISWTSALATTFSNLHKLDCGMPGTARHRLSFGGRWVAAFRPGSAICGHSAFRSYRCAEFQMKATLTDETLLSEK